MKRTVKRDLDVNEKFKKRAETKACPQIEDTPWSD